MLTDVDVRRAIEFESQGHSVLSVYLNVDPHRRTPEKYKLALRGLLHKPRTRLRQTSKRCRITWSWATTGRAAA